MMSRAILFASIFALCGRSCADLGPKVIRLKGGNPGVGDAGVRGMWDTHMLDLGSGKGNVLLFRHKDFGTAVELHGDSPGFFHYIERDGGNATLCTTWGTNADLLVKRQLMVNKSNIYDPDTGLAAPDVLREMSLQAGQRPMVAEWVDCGNWEAFADGRSCIKVTNHMLNATLALTRDGFISAGADAGRFQPCKPWGLRVACGGNAEKIGHAEAKAAIRALEKT